MLRRPIDPDPTVIVVAGVDCIACRDGMLLADGQRFTCGCGRSQAWCTDGGVELLGPSFAWMLSGPGTIRRRAVTPLVADGPTL